MKTLVNKVNPAIRITAPEIEVQEESDMYFIPVSDYCIPMCIDDWTLVEEESKHSEVWVEGRTIFEQDAKKPEIHDYETQPEILKPCPFCGEKPFWHHSRNRKGDYFITIKCRTCGATMEQGVKRFSPEWLVDKMITKWNTRR